MNHKFRSALRLPMRHRANRTNTDRHRQPVDIWLTIAIILLSLFGIVMMYNSSVAIGIRDFGDPYYYIKEQLRGFALGFVLFSIFSFIPYRKWQNIALPLLLITIVLLIFVFVPYIGVSALGAHRWLRIGSVIFQPAELAKFTLIVYLSAWLSKPEKNRLWSFLVLLGMVVGLVTLEPDLGTSIILVSIAFIIYFCAGSPMSHFLILMPISVTIVGIMAMVSPYRFSRLLTFLDPDRDPLGASYQIKQALLAIGSGGLTGLGLGQSRQKYEYLPEANTDSIFAVISEETGFLGATILIFSYIFIVWRGMKIAKNAPDQFGRLLASGIVGWFGIQTALNICAMLSLIPLTGIPLPLISYGSSSLVIMLASFGILLNISRHSP